jgi:hypothetical protein
VSGEASVSTNNFNNSTALVEPDTFEILNVTDDPGPEPTLPPYVATFLGEQLQAFYSQLINEPVPNRFVQLLDRLDRQRNRHNGN